jgi:hypothetical protein
MACCSLSLLVERSRCGGEAGNRQGQRNVARFSPVATATACAQSQVRLPGLSRQGDCRAISLRLDLPESNTGFPLLRSSALRFCLRQAMPSSSTDWSQRRPTRGGRSRIGFPRTRERAWRVWHASGAWRLTSGRTTTTHATSCSGRIR